MSPYRLFFLFLGSGLSLFFRGRGAGEGGSLAKVKHCLKPPSPASSMYKPISKALFLRHITRGPPWFFLAVCGRHLSSLLSTAFCFAHGFLFRFRKLALAAILKRCGLGFPAHGQLLAELKDVLQLGLNRTR